VRDFASYIGSGNVMRAQDHLAFYEVDWSSVEHSHQSSNTTLLHRAKDADTAALLLGHGATYLLEVNTEPGEEGRQAGQTTLQAAVRKGQWSKVQLLIERGAYYDPFSAAGLGDLGRLSEFACQELETLDVYGSTVLHWAAASGTARCVDWLLGQGLDVNAGNEFGETPLLMAALASVYDHRDSCGPLDRTEVVALLVERGAVLDVYAAAALDDVEVLSVLLAGDNRLVRATNCYESTPLHFAAWAGADRSVRLLLEAGADVDAKDRADCPPLFYAAYWGRSANVGEILLEHEADVFWTNIWGKSMSAYDAEFDSKYWYVRRGGSEVHAAALAGDTVALMSLVGAGPGCVNERSRLSATPLHCAVASNQVAAACFLIEQGAEIEARMDGGLSPLFCAAHAGAADAVALLLNAGADVMGAGESWQGALSVGAIMCVRRCCCLRLARRLMHQEGRAHLRPCTRLYAAPI
jgi:ankyrin repeat protein